MDDSAANIFFLLTLKVLSTSSTPEAAYQIFKGFKLEDWTTTTAVPITTTIKRGHAQIKTTTQHNRVKPKPKMVTTRFYFLTAKDWFHNENTVTTPFTFLTAKDWYQIENTVTTPFTFLTAGDWYHENTTVLPNKKVKVDCPEAETPSNIGPYEVPTERDLVLHTMKTLHLLFTSYHQKAMLFLDDIQKVVRATDQVAQKCRGNKVAYVQCVRHISNKCQAITKSLTRSLERQRQDILALGQKTICSLNAMKEDPVKLIKILAGEEASLEFALPGFLRLLSTCNAHCLSPTSGKNTAKKPYRHLSDTDVVIRHFLTKKNYKRVMQPANGVFKIPVPNGNKRKP